MNYNPVQQAASRHVDLADHYAREQVEAGTITITYLETERMVADVLTKPLTPAKFKNFAKFLVSKIA